MLARSLFFFPPKSEVAVAERPSRGLLELVSMCWSPWAGLHELVSKSTSGLCQKHKDLFTLVKKALWPLSPDTFQPFNQQLTESLEDSETSSVHTFISAALDNWQRRFQASPAMVGHIQHPTVLRPYFKLKRLLALFSSQKTVCFLPNKPYSEDLSASFFLFPLLTAGQLVFTGARRREGEDGKGWSRK